MGMNKEFLVCLVCVVLIGAGWGGQVGWQRYQVAQKKQAAEKAAQVPLLKAREQMLAQIQQVKESRAGDDHVAAAGTSPAAAPTTAPGGNAAAGKPAAPTPAPEDVEMKDFLAHARLSSILLGSPKIVVINKKSYEEGEEVALPSGHRAKVSEIREDGVTLTREGRAYQLLAKR